MGFSAPTGYAKPRNALDLPLGGYDISGIRSEVEPGVLCTSGGDSRAASPAAKTGADVSGLCWTERFGDAPPSIQRDEGEPVCATTSGRRCTQVGRSESVYLIPYTEQQQDPVSGPLRPRIAGTIAGPSPITELIWINTWEAFNRRNRHERVQSP